MNNQEFMQKAFERLLAKEAAKNIMPMDLDPGEVEDTPESKVAPAKYVYHNANTKDTKGVAVYANVEVDPGSNEVSCSDHTVYANPECTIPADPADLYRKIEDGASVIFGFESPYVSSRQMMPKLEKIVFAVTEEIAMIIPHASQYVGGTINAYALYMYDTNYSQGVELMKFTSAAGDVDYTLGFNLTEM